MGFGVRALNGHFVGDVYRAEFGQVRVDQILVVPDWQLLVLGGVDQNLQQARDGGVHGQAVLEVPDGLVTQVVVGGNSTQSGRLNTVISPPGPVTDFLQFTIKDLDKKVGFLSGLVSTATVVTMTTTEQVTRPTPYNTLDQCFFGDTR